MCRLFSEDPTTTQSDEFFGIFDYFISSFEEARADNENVRKKKEEEEKIAKQHQEVKYIIEFLFYWKPMYVTLTNIYLMIWLSRGRTQ